MTGIWARGCRLAVLIQLRNYMPSFSLSVLYSLQLNEKRYGGGEDSVAGSPPPGGGGSGGPGSLAGGATGQG